MNELQLLDEQYELASRFVDNERKLKELKLINELKAKIAQDKTKNTMKKYSKEWMTANNVVVLTDEENREEQVIKLGKWYGKEVMRCLIDHPCHRFWPLKTHLFSEDEHRAGYIDTYSNKGCAIILFSEVAAHFEGEAKTDQVNELPAEHFPFAPWTEVWAWDGKDKSNGVKGKFLGKRLEGNHPYIVYQNDFGTIFANCEPYNGQDRVEEINIEEITTEEAEKRLAELGQRVRIVNP